VSEAEVKKMPDPILAIQIGRAVMGAIYLAMMARPKATPEFRRRFWWGTAILLGIALTGLHPLRTNHEPWVRYASVFQCIFNCAVVAVLMMRYWLYMPRQDVNASKI